MLAPHAHAMADVSDGLLIDADRIATASGLSVVINLSTVPRSAALTAFAGEDRAARIAAVTAGDDYALILAAAPSERATIVGFRLDARRIGCFAPGTGVTLHDGTGPVPLPGRLGYVHGRTAPIR